MQFGTNYAHHFVECLDSALSGKGGFDSAEKASSLSFSSDNRFLAAGSEDGFITFLDLKTIGANGHE